jgi:hypothetical protein
LAGVAQLVEQLIRNQQVSGSNPLAGSMTLYATIDNIPAAIHLDVEPAVHIPVRHNQRVIIYRVLKEVSMKCIDAVEGTVKCIINEMYTAHTRDSTDDSEYIYNVKTVIDATDQYVRNHPEFIDDPEILKQVLYAFSRDLWLKGQYPASELAPVKSTLLDEENEEYQTYYYDYIYNRGVYPG